MHSDVFWDYSKNTASSYSLKDRIWLLCKENHSWNVSKKSLQAGRGCPYCSGNKVNPGVNDLNTLFPHIAREWHPTMNGDVKPDAVFAKSSKKIWWVCNKGHFWLCSIKHRTLSKVTCNVCSNRVVLAGFNDLDSLFPDIAAQWHPTLNVGEACEVVSGSHKKAWWVCGEGHEWEAAIVDRTLGKGCPVCSGKKTVENFNDVAFLFPYLEREWNVPRNLPFVLKNFTAGSNKKAWWICNKGHEWEAPIVDRTSGHGCKICKRSFSAPEEELFNFFTSMNLLVERNSKVFENGQELDFYFPTQNVAVEFNGIYWHNEKYKPIKYHYDKWKACKDKGIQLIQVWEDDFAHNSELVKRMLAYKLGVTAERKVFARKTVVRSLTQLQANELLNEYHIQGAVDGGIRVGLFENGRDIENLVAIMVLKREPGTEGKTLNLLRYATITNVVGGFTKLLKYVEKEFTPESIVSFSDNAVSDGGLYGNNGFVAVKDLKPDYMYVVKGERVHKFNYRLKRFREDPSLWYEEGLSERELAALNKISRIWDAGKTKWVWYSD